MAYASMAQLLNTFTKREVFITVQVDKFGIALMLTY